MGSSAVHTWFDGTLTKEELKTEYDRRVSLLRIEYGSDPYNGTLATCSGLTISSMTFDTNREALDYVIDNTEKWGNAMAVMSKGIVRGEAEYTFCGKKGSTGFPVEKVWKDGRVQILCADQLSPEDRERAVSLFVDEDVCRTTLDPAEALFNHIVGLCRVWATPLPDDYEVSFVRAATAMRAARKAYEVARAANGLFCDRIKEKYAAPASARKTWIVGGWAAE